MKHQKLKAGKPILGVTSTSAVKLDCDKFSLKRTKRIAVRICEFHNLHGFIILKSSSKCYHIVFDRPVSWRKNVSIMAWACYVTGFNLPLMRYLCMQSIKMSSTLRISSKRRKRPPRIVYRYGRQDCMIRDYLQTRREVRTV